MKYLLFPLLFFFSFGLLAQAEHRVSVDGRILLFKEIDKLMIVGHDGDEVKLTRNGGSAKVDDRAAGLRKISASGKQDNTGLGLSAQGFDDRVVIEQIGRGNGRIVAHVPNDAIVQIEQSTYHGGDLVVDNFAGELDVSMHYHQVKLSNCYGPLSVNAIYGDVEATFSAGPPKEEIRLHSTYQDVDITLPGNTSADVRLSTSYGSMYTDFDLDIGEFKAEEHDHEKGHGHCHDDCKHGAGRSGLTGKINGGGKLLSLTASYQDIYLRKLK